MNAPATLPEPIRPPKILLMGPPGSGKTYSLGSAVKAGLKVAVLITEPGSQETLIDSCQRQRISMENLHWKYVGPSAMGFAALKNLAKQINLMSYADLSNMKHGIDKSSQGQIMEFLNAIDNFTCDRTGRELGSVATWDDTWLFAVDSLSGLNMLAMANTVGSKPAPAPGEWGVAMGLEEAIINKLTSDLRCYFVLLAHVDRAIDEASQQVAVYPAALGSKLGPKLGRFFSEVVYTKQVVDKFYWSTVEIMVNTKARALPLSKEISPDFAQLVSAHQRRKKELPVT